MFAQGLMLLAAAVAAAPQSAPRKPERRCGWLVNPTPANFWLTDRHGSWLLGAQGAYQAPGMDDMPDMTTRGWVKMNNNYGYGCGCITAVVDHAGKRVIRLLSAEPRPMRQCRADRRLPSAY